MILSLLLENGILRAKKRLTEDEGMKETPKQRGMKRRKMEGEREREREREKQSRIATRAHVCTTTNQADTDDGRPCLVTSPARLDGIHLFVRPLPVPFAD